MKKEKGLQSLTILSELAILLLNDLAKFPNFSGLLCVFVNFKCTLACHESKIMYIIMLAAVLSSTQLTSLFHNNFWNYSWGICPYPLQPGSRLPGRPFALPL